MKKELGLIAAGALVAVVLLGATTALVLRDDGIQFPDGSVQTTAADSGLVVRDSVGNFVGPVISFMIGPGTGPGTPGQVAPLVLFRYENEPIVLKVAESELRAIKGFWLADYTYWRKSVRYQYPGCVGEVFFPASHKNEMDHLIGESYAIGYDNVIFRDTGLAPQNGSTWQSESDGPGHCSEWEVQPVDSFYWHLAEPVVDLDDLFTPPYHLE